MRFSFLSSRIALYHFITSWRKVYLKHTFPLLWIYFALFNYLLLSLSHLLNLFVVRITLSLLRLWMNEMRQSIQFNPIQMRRSIWSIIRYLLIGSLWHWQRSSKFGPVLCGKMIIVCVHIWCVLCPDFFVLLCWIMFILYISPPWYHHSHHWGWRSLLCW